MVEIDEKEYQEYLKFKKRKYLDTNVIPLEVDWAKMVFKFNPYLSKGDRNSSKMKCFIKKFKSDKRLNVQLQVWCGKTPYIFDVLDASEEQIKYNKEHNVGDYHE